MRPRVVALLVAVCVLLWPGCAPAQERPISFNLSTNRSFAPGEQPKIHLYTHNVDALEFRVYRVNDPVKFLEGLRQLHSFGPEAGLLPREQIDQRTWLERFHDWKQSVWESIREFFRHQFSHDARKALRGRQSAIERRSRIVTEAEFAQIPLLNRAQLVSRWRQLVPPTFISDSNTLAVPKLGAGLYLVEATDGHYKAYTLLMVSSMALVTRTGSAAVLAFTVDRKTGQPIAGVKVDTGFGQKADGTATTDTDGVAQLALAKETSAPDNFWVVASKGDDVAVSTPYSWALNFSETPKVAGYVFTERPVYRPTHTVHWKAILREHKGNMLALPQPGTAHVSIADGNGKNVFEGDLPLNAEGDVSGDYTLPKDAALGDYWVRVGPSAKEFVTATFHVEDYRKPEYRVQVSAAQKRVLEGATVPVTIDSRYFFGEPVAHAKVKYRIYHERHDWWGEDADDTASDAPLPDDSDSAASYNGEEEAEQTGKLDANGMLVVQVPTHPDARGHGDFDYTVEAGVTDAANREITGRGRFLATYGTFRINIEPVSYALHPGDAAKFRVTAVDYDGKPVSTHVHVQLLFRHWAAGKSETVAGSAVDVTTDAEGHAAGELAIGTPPYSSAELHATAAAVQQGTPGPQADTSVWIIGAGEMDWASSSETAQMVADKKSYAPGDVAHLSILSENAGFYALVLAEGNTLAKREVVHTDGKNVSFDLPITAEAQPNITVSALFLRDGVLFQASRVLKVPPVQQQLAVQITPARNTLQPQQTVSYDVVTRDAAGKPVTADVSFGVVDEAIYSLYPDSSGDMVRALYPQRYVEAQVDSSLDFFFSGEAGVKSPMLAMRNVRFHPQLAQVKPGNEAKPRVRKAFPDTAFWAPVVHTDGAGHARVSFAFPDSLTTWRATVHAITATSQAGSAINRVLVRKNVLVRMGTPRFMVKGDEITVPVIAHNYLDTAAQASVSLKAEGLEIVSGAQSSVVIPSKGEATVLWRLRAAQVGTAKLTAAAISAQESDALELSFPVEPAGVAKVVASSGVIAPAAQQANTSFTFPVGTDAAAHSLRVDVSASVAGSLVSALDYLTSFPYGCTEQTMSSYLPNVIVNEMLHRVSNHGGVDEADLRAKMQAGLERLKDYQHDDGGWGWWKEDESRVHMTAYVVSGIALGQQYVPLTPEQNSMQNRGKAYLHRMLDQHPRMRPELRAAVVYALAEAHGRNLAAAFDAQWQARDGLDAEALALTGLGMAAANDSRASEIGKLLESKAIHTGELVSWKSSYAPMLDYEYRNDAEATAYAVRLLGKLNPANPLLPPAAQWLMLQRDGGTWWGSTEQTAMVLFGLVDYLAGSQELNADFTADVVVNGRSAGTHHFTPAEAENGGAFTLELDAAHLQPGANTVEIVRRSGNGRVYWSSRAQFYSTERHDARAASMSLNLTRDIFKLQPVQKDGRVVYTLQPFSGTAQIGDVLAVHTAINGAPARYLMLEDPIPAGAEFVANEESYEIEKRPGGWYGWYTRREFHDDHAAFFADDFDGRQEVFYLIRIVNPGTFQISPARVEPMYQPGVQATSDALQLQVPAPAQQGGVQ